LVSSDCVCERLRLETMVVEEKSSGCVFTYKLSLGHSRFGTLRMRRCS
jgi:hypothetical protein